MFKLKFKCFAMLCNRTFCITLFAAVIRNTQNITANFTNFISFLLFEKTQSQKDDVFKSDVFRFLEKWA